jgi:hypothetical protein
MQAFLAAAFIWLALLLIGASAVSATRMGASRLEPESEDGALLPPPAAFGIGRTKRLAIEHFGQQPPARFELFGRVYESRLP